MKKYLVALLMGIPFVVGAQTVQYVDRLRIREEMRLIDKTVNEILVDSSEFVNSTHLQLATARAIYEFVQLELANVPQLWTENGTNIHPTTAESLTIGRTTGEFQTRLVIQGTGTGSSHYLVRFRSSNGDLVGEVNAQGTLDLYPNSNIGIDLSTNDADIKMNNSAVLVWGSGGPYVSKQNNGVGLRGSTATGVVAAFIRQTVIEGQFTGANGMELDRITTYTNQGTLDISGWRGGSGTRGGDVVVRGGTATSSNLGYGGTLYLRGGGGNSGAITDTAGIIKIQVPLDGGGALQDMAIITNEYLELKTTGIKTTGLPTADLDVNGFARLRGLGSAPAGNLGGLYTSTVDNSLYFHNGTSWQALATGGGTTFWVDGTTPGVDVTLTNATKVGIGTTAAEADLEVRSTSTTAARIGQTGGGAGYWAKFSGTSAAPTLQLSAGANTDDALKISNGDITIDGSGTEIRLTNHSATNLDQLTISKAGGRLAAFTTIGTSGGSHVVAMGRDVDDLTAPILEMMATNSFATSFSTVYDVFEISSRVSPGSTSFNRWSQNGGLGWSIHGKDQATGTDIIFHRQYAQKVNDTNDPSDIKYIFQGYWDGGAYTPMNFSGNGVYINGTGTATAVLDINGDLRVRAGGLLIDPQSSEPTGSAGKIYSDSDDNKLYHHNGTSFKALAYEDDLPNARGYGNLKGNTLSAEIDIAGTEPAKTLVFPSTGISLNASLTDSTIVVTNAGDYEVNFNVTWVWTANGGGEPVAFSLYLNDSFVGEAGFIQKEVAGTDEYQSGAFHHQLALSASDVLKVKASGGGTTNKIKFLRTSFSVKRLN